MAFPVAGGARPRESLIKAIAEQINKSINDISGYRRVQVMIRGAEHIPPAPQQVVSLMMELVYAYNLDIRGGRDPFEREAEFHIRFERIHPFEDGNGRTGRILLNRGLLLSDVAPAVISVDDRAHYLDLIGHQDVAGLAGLLRRLPRRRRRGSRRSSGRVCGAAAPLAPPCVFGTIPVSNDERGVRHLARCCQRGA